jgi:tetratricopeptide (TPR) repeat protein
VAKICGKLEGMPLAIELAAARVGTLYVEDISERLGDSLKLLTGGGRTAVPRQRTLKGALDWSHDLLSEPERVLFRRLSVFAGGWTLDASEAVGSDGIEENDVLDLLGRLVEKSLVLAEVTEGGGVRYRMLEPVRQYAHEKLEGSKEAEAVRRRHAEYLLALAEEAESQLKGEQQEVWLKRLEGEHDNLRAALSWVLGSGEAELGMRLAGALGEFWYLRGHLGEGRRWLEEALAQEDTPSASTRAKALYHTGYIARGQGDYERSVALGEESLALYRRLGDKASSAAALYTLGWVALSRNELERTSTLVEETLTLQREMNDNVGLVRSLVILGLVATTRHDYERAMALYEETLSLAQKVQDGFTTGLSLTIGMLASLGRGEYRQTRVLCGEGLKVSQQLDMPQGIFSCLYTAACLAAAEEQAVRSARLWGAAEALREEIQTNNGDIYMVPADGSELPTRLTTNPALDFGPTFSPDGKIAFTSRRDGDNTLASNEMYVMNAAPESDSNVPLRLTNNKANDAQPDFSPDGTKIVFRSTLDGNGEIYVMDAKDRDGDGNGDNLKRLTYTPATSDQVDLSGTNEQWPNFSPDGAKILFWRGGGALGTDNGLVGHQSDFDSELYVMKAEPESATNVPINLTNTPTWGEVFPDWGPALTKHKKT